MFFSIFWNFSLAKFQPFLFFLAIMSLIFLVKVPLIKNKQSNSVWALTLTSIKTTENKPNNLKCLWAMTGPPNKRDARWLMSSPTFSEIVFCQSCFPGNSLLCHSPRHPKLFLIPAVSESCREPCKSIKWEVSQIQQIIRSLR